MRMTIGCTNCFFLQTKIEYFITKFGFALSQDVLNTNQNNITHYKIYLPTTGHMLSNLYNNPEASKLHNKNNMKMTKCKKSCIL